MIDNVLEMVKSHCSVDIYTVDNDGNILFAEKGFIAQSWEFKNRFYIFEICLLVNDKLLFCEQKDCFDALQLRFAAIQKINNEIVDAKVFKVIK